MQLACNVAAVSNDGVDREIQFVGNRFIGHALYNASNDLLFALAERFLFVVFLFFLFSVEKVVDFTGNCLKIVTDSNAFIILFQSIVV